jgi:hypothetical protein
MHIDCLCPSKNSFCSWWKIKLVRILRTQRNDMVSMWKLFIFLVVILLFSAFNVFFLTLEWQESCVTKKGFTLILPILGLGHPVHKTIIVDNKCFCVGCHRIYFFFGQLQCRICIDHQIYVWRKVVCPVVMRSTKPGCSRLCSWCLGKLSTKEGCMGLVPWRLDLPAKSFRILNDFFTEN